jgi:pimeloyl-ACP methyl ester carboxylesterase
MLLVLGGCSRQTPITGTTSLKAANLSELEKKLLARKPELDLFRLRGPFRVTSLKDVEIAVTPRSRVNADLYLSGGARQAPLVILVHGYGNSKDDHIFQALHLATWGLHVMAVDVPNRGPWIANGRMLAGLVKALHVGIPELEGRVELQKLILVGHSFGATAVAAALGTGAEACGAVLLDPAGIGRELPALLRKVVAPVLIIGADEEIWPTRNREYFFRFIPAAVGELSIRDSVHEDAQYPAPELPLRAAADGPIATEQAQITFASALTAAAFSLAATGTFDYAWGSFADAFRDDKFFNARKK